MDKLLLLKPFVKMIAEGKFFSLIFGWFLRIQAGLAVLGFLFGSFKLWSMLSGGFEIKTFSGILITQLLFIVLIYVLVNILLIRADDIINLPVATDYIVMPIIVIFVKMTGEILGVFYAIMGIIAALAILIAGSMPSIPGMGMFSGGNGFGGAIMALIGGPIVGFLLLSLFYFIGEQIGVLVDIARNTKR